MGRTRKANKGNLPQPVTREFRVDNAGSPIANGLTSAIASAVINWEAGPPLGEVWRVQRLTVLVKATGAFTADTYGPSTALTDGIDFTVRDNLTGAELYDLSSGLLIKKNSDWLRVGADLDYETWASGEETLIVNWDFEKTFGTPIRLDGDRKDVVRALVNSSAINDNSAYIGLTEHHFIIHGIIES